MAIGSLSGRSSHGRRAVRPHKSTASKRHRSDVKSDADEAVAAKPDIDELRKKRLGYYSVPSSERRRLSSVSSSSKVKPKISTTSISTVKAADSELKRRRRKHRSSSDKPEKKAATSKSRQEDFVYASDERVSEGGDDVRLRTSSSSDKTSKHASSSSRRQLPVVVEDELTPEDSISQVGITKSPERRKSSNTVRSSLKRSSTTPAKLPTIDEGDSIAKVATPSSRRSSKRDSTPSLLGIWRRNSVATTPPAPRLVECLTCASDDVPSTQSAKLTCGHRMCHECLKRVFEMSVKDPAHMPPKCCTNDHIPLKHVDNLFDLKFKMLWNRKYQEYHTKNKIYCVNSKCGDWIKPKHFHTTGGRKYAQCPRCATKVCTLCNGKLHRARECPKDPEIAKLVAQAKEKGWQSCYSCHAMVELKEGCNHMTCRCTAEFCMICGSKWKTCDCPWFNYAQLPDADRLMHMRVPEPMLPILERVMGAAGIPPPPRPADQRPRQAQQRRPTYEDELNERRRQERLDEDLARRLQLASLLDPEDEPPNRHRAADVQAWGLANEAGHFMNDNFVQNAANVVMSAFGDATMGRRGERSSGRRRRPRQEQAVEGDGGLVPNFLGDESVIGAARR